MKDGGLIFTDNNKRRRRWRKRRDRKMNCEHKSFGAEVDVHRLEDSGRFQVDVRIKCLECGVPFRFIGLPAGVDLNGASTSIDATEGRFAVAPKGEVVSALDGAAMGFSVRQA